MKKETAIEIEKDIRIHMFFLFAIKQKNVVRERWTPLQSHIIEDRLLGETKEREREMTRVILRRERERERKRYKKRHFRSILGKTKEE